MATIKQQGKGYKITVSRGYDINGKQLREHMTWVPAPGMTKRQIEKELNRQTVMFEEQIKASGRQDGNIKFIDFIDIFFNQKNYVESDAASRIKAPPSNRWRSFRIKPRAAPRGAPPQDMRRSR